MVRALLAIFLFLGIQESTRSQVNDEMFTIYLARHAEKSVAAVNPDDPPLSACGQRRAERLALMLRNVNLDRIYSTPYLRTRETALPAAAGHGLEVEAYDPAGLEAFAAALLNHKQNALVIGHSNTTAVLAGMIAGMAGEEFDEDEYDRLYLVTVSGDRNQVILLDQAFHCDEP